MVFRTRRFDHEPVCSHRRSVNAEECEAYRTLPAHAFAHKAARHSVGEYVRDMSYTDGIKQRFRAPLMRDPSGIYHDISARCLNRYINELSFRNNAIQVRTLTLGATVESECFRG